MIVTSNRGPDEWLATFADPVRAQAAIDRFTLNAYDLVIEGESYRARLKPGQKSGQKTGEEGEVGDVTPMRSRGECFCNGGVPSLCKPTSC